jgi:DMSO/TMAO reductase YedYZ molybdopterin-dependent catalytic subunit
MRFRRLHWRHVIVLGLLFLTGLGLFLSGWRTGLGALLPFDQFIHEAGGILYGVAVIGLGARFFPWPSGEPRRPAYAQWALFFLLLLTVSGMGLWVGPTWVHALSTVLHAGTSVAFLIWAGWHLVKHWPLERPKRPPSPALNAVSRRRFLRWAGAVAVGVPAWLALPTMSRVVTGSLAGSAAGTNSDALPGFVPYTVVNGYPNISRDAWRLTLEGLGERRVWNWERWTAEPVVHTVFNFRCVTGWDVPNITARGVDLYSFLKAQGWNPDQHPWVLFYSGDGVYTESLSYQQIAEYRPMMAYELEGKPLAVSQGYPVRLLVPNMYGYKSIKWLVGIRLVDHDTLGYWEVRGYPENALIGSYGGIPLGFGHARTPDA